MAAYSKTQVDKAGRGFAELISRIAEDSAVLEDPTVLVQAREMVPIIEWWRSEHAKPLSRVASNLGRYVGEQGEPVVAQRLKRVPTIAGKLLREPSMKLSRMADIGGVRAIVPDQEAAYRIATRLQRNWSITRMRDYVAEPKDDGYRALHLINRNQGRLVEIQLRTFSQDVWANIVERQSRTKFPGLKFGGGPPELRDYLFDLAEILAEQDLGLASGPETRERIEARSVALVNLVKENES